MRQTETYSRARKEDDYERFSVAPSSSKIVGSYSEIRFDNIGEGASVLDASTNIRYIKKQGKIYKEKLNLEEM